jgi:hypothetical protein
MIGGVLSPTKHVSYTQDSCRRCCAAEGLPGRADFVAKSLERAGIFGAVFDAVPSVGVRPERAAASTHWY